MSANKSFGGVYQECKNRSVLPSCSSSYSKADVFLRIKAVWQLVWSMQIVSDTDGAEMFLLYWLQNHIYCTLSAVAQCLLLSAN